MDHRTQRETMLKYRQYFYCLQEDLFSSYEREMKKLKKTPCPFGEVVFAARTAQGISRYRLAKLIGRTSQQLAKLEKGENEPVLSTIVMIARALEIDPCILFSQTVEMMSSIATEDDTAENENNDQKREESDACPVRGTNCGDVDAPVEHVATKKRAHMERALRPSCSGGAEQKSELTSLRR